jgi:hypothetical protein
MHGIARCLNGRLFRNGDTLVAEVRFLLVLILDQPKRPPRRVDGDLRACCYLFEYCRVDVLRLDTENST